MSRFDVVVVGAGSAGSVLAARLARGDRAVLLVEAGPGSAGDHADVLAGGDFFEAVRLPDRTWPTTARQSSGSRPVPYLHGSGLGGSSAINGMVTDVGIPEDYDAWEGAGADGWAWADLAPWFGRTALTLSQAPDADVGSLGRALLAALPANARRLLLSRGRDGRRVSAADAYLGADRDGLTILAGNTVDRLVLDDRRVTGVRFADGTEIEADEVIVAAGAIGSPALLLRSGIDTPGIGDNLCDHPGFGIVLVDERSTVDHTAQGPAIAVGARLTSGEEPADLQVLAIEHLGRQAPGTAMLLVGLMSAQSRGTVRLGRSAGVDVELNLLGDERDVRRLQSGVDQVFRLLERGPLDAWRPLTEHPRSADALRSGLGGYYHAAGTCALGTVVDSSCRVVGYAGLRVCDASIMPSLPRAGPHFTVVAMAERLAATIDEA